MIKKLELKETGARSLESAFKLYGCYIKGNNLHTKPTSRRLKLMVK